MRHIWAIVISVLLFFLFYTIWTFYDDTNKTYHIKIAASGKGDTYKTAQAIAKVTHAHYDNIYVDVIASTGSTQSEKLLADGLVDLAMIQADTIVTAGSKLISLIYPDAFQLIVRADSDIHSVADLKGKQIALADKTSGQYRSFWTLAKHYGLSYEDIHAKSMSNSAADFALKHNAIDAIFRVRPSGNTKIKKLIEESNARLIPITQANAMQIDESAFVSGIIPKGAYQGFPAIPKRDLETIVVYRLLIASKDLDIEVAKKITTVLFEEKQELQSHIKLSGLAQLPSKQSGTILAIHEGAQNYYDREEPSLVAKYVDKFGFILTIGAFLGSLLLQLRSHRQKIRAEKYTTRLMKIIKKAQKHQEKEILTGFAQELNEMLDKVHNDLNKYRIDQDGFETFSFYWEMARDEVNEELLGDAYDK
jgi:TRAP transporter TAXI family solute receptor